MAAMDLGLLGRVVLVTGGSSGIGRACVELLLQEGAKVATCGRDEARLEGAMRPLAERYPGQVMWRVADVCLWEQVDSLLDAVRARFGGLDALVNNAGASRTSTFETTSDQDWRDELELKFFGVINPVRAGRSMLAQSDQASVVNLNAVLARQPEPHLVATSAARAGLLNLSKSMATELGAHGIRVNSVCVGLIDTGQWKRRYDQSQSDLDFPAWSREIAADRGAVLRRFGTADEVAAAVAFLLSARAGYTTGTVVEVAGGVSRYV